MGRPRNKELWKQHIGEGVSKMTPEAVKKLEEAFAMDCSIAEACLYAGITKPTYYSWIEKNPQLLSRFEELRETPVLLARSEVVKGLAGDKRFSLEYLGRKAADMRPSAKLELAGKVQTEDVSEGEDIKKLRDEFDSKLRAAIVARRKGTALPIKK